MRSHKIEPYRSVLDALTDSGCPLCRYLRNFQFKCVQSVLKPRPTGICNFHAWAVAATHDRLDASQVFLNLLTSQSLGGTPTCDICRRLEVESSAQFRLIISSFKTMTPTRWLEAYGEICIPHANELRQKVPQSYVKVIDRANALYRDRLVDTLKDQQGADIEGPGWGILGHAAEFLTGQRGLYR